MALDCTAQGGEYTASIVSQHSEWGKKELGITYA